MSSAEAQIPPASQTGADDATSGDQPAKMPWLAIVLAFVVSEVAMIACAFAWVFIYSVTIMTTGDAAYYEAYAQVASPVVAVTVALPIFFLVGRWMRRYGNRARRAALAVVGLNLALDVLVVSTMAVDLPYNVGMSALAAGLKIAGAILGSRNASKA